MAKEVNLGVSVMARKERGVDLGDSLSVITDMVWQTAETLHNLGDSGLSDVAKKTIEDKFAAVGVNNYMALSKGHKARTLTVQQEALWMEMTDAMAVCVYIVYGDNEDFFGEVDMAKKSDNFTDLMNGYFNTPALVGTEQLIADYVPASEELRETMGLISVLMRTGGLNEAILGSYISDVSRISVNRHDKSAKQMIVGYLGEMVAGIQGASGTKTEEYAAKQLEQARIIDEITMRDLLDSFLYITPPRNKTREADWDYRPPEWLPNITTEDEWRRLLTFSEHWLGAIYNKRADDGYNNDLEYVSKKVMGMQPLKEGDLEPWFNHPDLQVRGVMCQIMKELLVPIEIKRKIDGKEVTRKIFVFETEPDPNDKTYKKERRKQRIRYKSELVRQLTSSEKDYKDGLIIRLVAKGGVLEGKDPRAAKMAAALAFDVMEMGGVFSLADTLRKLNWESDVVRLVQRPINKVEAKAQGGEIWGGPCFQYCIDACQGDTVKAFDEAMRLGMLPALMFGSFLDLPLPSQGDKSMGERLWEGENFNLQKNSDTNFYYKWRKDHMLPAIKIWFYMTKRFPLELNKALTLENAVQMWSAELVNAYKQLGQNDDNLCHLGTLASAIGGSTDLWRFTGPYLRVSGIGGDERHETPFEVMYVTGREILDKMPLKDEERIYLLRYFGLDSRYRNDFGRKINFYKVYMNSEVGSSVRTTFRSLLWTPRKE